MKTLRMVGVEKAAGKELQTLEEVWRVTSEDSLDLYERTFHGDCLEKQKARLGKASTRTPGLGSRGPRVRKKPAEERLSKTVYGRIRLGPLGAPVDPFKAVAAGAMPRLHEVSAASANKGERSISLSLGGHS